MTHTCLSKLTIIGSDNGLTPGRRQAIIWTNAGILLIRPSGTNFNEMLIEILTFSFMKMRLNVSSAKSRPFCLGLNVLNKLLSKEVPGEVGNPSVSLLLVGSPSQSGNAQCIDHPPQRLRLSSLWISTSWLRERLKNETTFFYTVDCIGSV